MTTELEAMAEAMRLGTEAVGLTSPNPPVGAVVLADGQIVGRGHTQPPGGPHAEIMALREAGDRARGGTVVCTLEPCAHTGRTGPCARAIIDAGVRRVVYAVADPNPLAAGGHQELVAAGIEVVAGLGAADAADGALRCWLHHQRHGRPLITWKVGQSLDGQVAAEDGSSQWITSEQSRADVHAMRQRIDAILVGAGTVRRDNPRLTARNSAGELAAHQPLRVVVSSRGQIPLDAAVLDDSAPTLLAVGADTSQRRLDLLTNRGVQVWRSPGDPGAGVDLAALARQLGERGVLHALVEGGPTTAGSFISAGLVDEVIAYVAPKLLLSGLWPALRGYGVGSIQDAIELEIQRVERCGADVRITATPRSAGSDGGPCLPE